MGSKKDKKPITLEIIHGTYMAQSKKNARDILRRLFGARKYRITTYNVIHAYGTMPNTGTQGWYLAGWILDLED